MDGSHTSTPNSRKLSTYRPFAPAPPDAKATKVQQSKELTNHWIGPMPVGNFLHDFLPAAQELDPRLQAGAINAFKGIESDVEDVLYTAFISCIVKHNLTPDLTWVDISQRPDATAEVGKKIIPDLAAYKQSTDLDGNPLQWDAAELFCEFKAQQVQTPTGERTKTASDAFKDPSRAKIQSALKLKQVDILPDLTTVQSGAASRSTGPPEFEAQAKDRLLVRGQLASYLTEWFNRQYRLFGFMIFMAFPYVRFLRADRSGIIVTEKFSILEEPIHLIDFLRRFNQAAPQQRGLDDTVQQANAIERQLASLSLPEPDRARPVVVVQVPDGEGCFREVLAWGLDITAESLTGQSNRTWVVCDKDTGEKIMYLKESWRNEVLDKEADILKQLNGAKVRNVPTILWGGDVEGESLDHCTIAQKYATETWNAFGAPPEGLSTRVHHRILTDFVGFHLESFNSPKECFQAVYDTVLAHQDAYEKCKILHRDVNGSNIMIAKETRRGVLHDWDQFKRLKDILKGPSQPQRSVNWQFASAKILGDPSALHTLHDDIESFVYVVAHFAIRYMDHDQPGNTPNLMQIFESNELLADGSVKGGASKYAVFTTPNHSMRDLHITNNDALSDWLGGLLDGFSEWYTLLNVPERKKAAKLLGLEVPRIMVQSVPKDSVAGRLMGDHEAFVRTMVGALESKGWSPSLAPACDSKEYDGQELSIDFEKQAPKRQAPSNPDRDDDESAKENQEPCQKKQKM